MLKKSSYKYMTQKEKRELKKFEHEAEKRKRYNLLKRQGKLPRSNKISTIRLILFILIIILIYHYWNQITLFLQNLF